MTALPDHAVQKAREATEALIDASKVVLHDLRHNQQDLEALLGEIGAPLHEEESHDRSE